MTKGTIHSFHKLQVWFDALTCEASERTSADPLHAGHDELARIALEAAMVRKVLVHRNTQVRGPVAASSPGSHQKHRETTLMHARQAGLFLRKKQRFQWVENFLVSLSGSSPPKDSSSRLQGVAKALQLTRVGITVACGVILVGLYLLSRPEVEPEGYPGGVVMRGDEQAQRLIAANPGALADQIEIVLREEGVQIRRTVAGQAIEIQAKASAISSGGRSRLLALGVKVPAHGRLHIRLDQK